MRAFVRAMGSANVLAGQTGSNTGGGSTGGSGGGSTGGGSTGGGTPSPGSSGFTATFGTRTPSAAISIRDVSNQTISGLYFSGIGNDVTAIRLENCHNMVIEQNDFQDCCEPICLVYCSNITVRYNRARNITGPYIRNGSNRGNLIQTVYCDDGIYIGYNIAIGGNTEDLISVYMTHGTAVNPTIVEYNKLRNYDYVSVSGSGIMVGDGSGSYIIVRNNILDTPGQVGIGVPGGNNISIQNNTVYSAQHAGSNIGMYVANYSQDSNMHDITVTGNQVNWTKEDGTKNAFYNDGAAGQIDTSSNNFNAAISQPTFTIEG